MVTPVCPYYSSCSGCSLQHLDYTQQLENKKKNVAKLLKLGNLNDTLNNNNNNNNNIQVFSAEPFYYRNRLEFWFHSQGMGLRKKDHPAEIIDVQQCPIVLPRINELLLELRAEFSNVNAFNLRTKTGLFRQAVIRATTTGDSSISFVLNEDAPEKAIKSAQEEIKAFADKTTANNVLITFVPAEVDEAYSANYQVIKGKDYLTEELLGKRFCYSIQGFFQNNSTMAEKMLEYVCGLLKKHSPTETELLDLYSGVGTFGLTNSALFKKVILVENVPAAITFAKQNIAENKITNASAYALQAHQLSRINFAKDKELVVVADPPRTGMDQKTIVKLNTLKPKVIIYVSCNPTQLAKDLVKFKQYKLNSVALFDLFPQTVHSEVIVELVYQK
ncbi:MAG: 23S rRNA (uracil(1939)-C(5))-methyltransferase RlmD [Nanoarchaeota archaeon]|mgnify:CR=1 FL=1